MITINANTVITDALLIDDMYPMYRAAFKNHPEAMFLLDSEGFLRKCNQWLCDLLGNTSQNLLARKFIDLIPESQRALVLGLFHDALESKLNQQFEMICPHRGDREIYIQTTLVPATVDDCNCVLGYCIDITDKVDLERELRESREHFTRIQEVAQLGTCLLDLETHMIEFDDIAQSIFGFSSRDVPLEEFRERIFSDDRGRIASAIQFAMEEPKLIHGAEYRMVHPDGSVRYVQVHQTTYSDASKRPRLLGVVEDITARRLTEEKSRKSEKLLIIGELAAGMAHEIRNPLTVAKGLTTLLQANQVKKDKQENYFQLIIDSLEQIERITTEMLVLARPHVDTRTVKNIVETTIKVLELFDAEIFMHNVKITWQYNSDWIPVLCNEQQIKQAFINIVKNALEAKAYRLDVAITVLHETVAVTIRDNGHGIDPDHMRHLGQPFFTTKEAGMGLGFMISKKIIHDHNGELEITSEIGIGTCICVVLPIANKKS